MRNCTKGSQPQEGVTYREAVPPPSAEISTWRGSPVWKSVASSVNQKCPFSMLNPVTEADEGATC